MSELASSVAEKKRLIIKNPDGSFFYCKSLKVKLIHIKINNFLYIQRQQNRRKRYCLFEK